MLYLDFAVNKEDLLSEKELKLPKFFRKIIYNFRYFTGQVLKYKIEGKNVIVLPKINKFIYKKLNKIFKVDVTKNVCICDELLRRDEFVEYLNNKNLNICDGKWLFKYMMVDIINYICAETGIPSEFQEISILTNECNILVCENIKKIADKVKNINIITKELKKFKKLEKEVYETKGLIINITNNMRKSTLKSNIILNLDFEQEDFDKINFPKKAIIINCEEKTKIKIKSFNGINCLYFSINIPIKYQKIYSKLNRFNSVNLYESIIYKRTMAQNIWKEIENDGIEISCLEGKNGMIRFNEFLRVLA